MSNLAHSEPIVVVDDGHPKVLIFCGDDMPIRFGVSTRRDKLVIPEVHNIADTLGHINMLIRASIHRDTVAKLRTSYKDKQHTMEALSTRAGPHATVWMEMPETPLSVDEIGPLLYYLEFLWQTVNFRGHSECSGLGRSKLPKIWTFSHRLGPFRVQLNTRDKSAWDLQGFKKAAYEFVAQPTENLEKRSSPHDPAVGCRIVSMVGSNEELVAANLTQDGVTHSVSFVADDFEADLNAVPLLEAFLLWFEEVGSKYYKPNGN